MEITLRRGRLFLGLSLGGVRDFLLFLNGNSQAAVGPLFLMFGVYRTVSPPVKWPGRDADHSGLSGA